MTVKEYEKIEKEYKNSDKYESECDEMEELESAICRNWQEKKSTKEKLLKIKKLCTEMEGWIVPDRQPELAETLLKVEKSLDKMI